MKCTPGVILGPPVEKQITTTKDGSPFSGFLHRYFGNGLDDQVLKVGSQHGHQS
jgi:hypothetical protein